jgi:hypothetical protein
MESSRHILSTDIKLFLMTELADKPFVKKSLSRLLDKKYYNVLKLENITISYIPLKTINMTRILQRLIYLKNILHITNTISIWFIPCKEKRFFPKSGIIEEKHINGGYTYTSNHTIIIYRLQEFPKVMLHELIHNSLIDTTIPKEKELELYKLFSIDTTQCDSYCNTQLRINEAVVEAWALLYQLMFVSAEYKLSFKKLFKEELEWSLYLCKKLFKMHKNKWIEKSHSYSYIRLKTCILYFMKDFIKLKYPYSATELIKFFKTYNLKTNFIKAIEHAKDFKTNQFRMMLHSDL